MNEWDEHEMMKRDMWCFCSEWDCFVEVASSSVDVLIRIEDESASFLAVLLRARTQEAQRCKERYVTLIKWMIFLSVVGEWWRGCWFYSEYLRFWIFLNFFECFSTVSFINSIESLKMFFSEYEHKELEQALRIDIHTQYFILF